MSRANNRARAREARRRFGRGVCDFRAPLESVPRASWPYQRESIVAVWMSTSLTVQAYRVSAVPGAIRLSINRNDARPGLSWDDLAWVVHETYPGRWGVEVFPPSEAIVNVANMRHVWLCPVGVAPPFDLRG